MTYRAHCAGRVWHRARKNARWMRLHRNDFTWAAPSGDAYAGVQEYLDTLHRRIAEAVLGPALKPTEALR